jgi:hypothetical protein
MSLSTIKLPDQPEALKITYKKEIKNELLLLHVAPK